MAPPPAPLHRPALLALHVPDCAPATVLLALGALVYLMLLLWQAASAQACTTIVVGREATTGQHTISDAAWGCHPLADPLIPPVHAASLPAARMVAAMTCDAQMAR